MKTKISVAFVAAVVMSTCAFAQSPLVTEADRDNTIFSESTGNANGAGETGRLGNNGVDEPFVECATCHDPHRGSGTNPAFMRLSNTDSDVCLACHVK